jgi:tetratricopeptide (TPR) repeat protein
VRVRAIGQLLVDPIRYVRIEAARALADAPLGAMTEQQRQAHAAAFAELVESEMIAADRPESHLNLASVYLRSSRPGDAGASLRTALRLDPAFVPALVNLADLYRATNRAGEEEATLVRALDIAPGNPEALHALGLLRVRQRRHQEALDLLRRAAEARPDSARLAYVYGVALSSAGFAVAAIETLRRANDRHPNNREILIALATFQRDRGDLAGAETDAERLVAVAPYDRRFQALLEQIRLQRQRRRRP